METTLTMVEKLVATLEDWEIYRAFRQNTLVLTTEIKKGFEMIKVGIKHPALDRPLNIGYVFTTTLDNVEEIVKANRESFDRIESRIDTELGL